MHVLSWNYNNVQQECLHFSGVYISVNHTFCLLQYMSAVCIVHLYSDIIQSPLLHLAELEQKVYLNTLLNHLAAFVFCQIINK